MELIASNAVRSQPRATSCNALLEADYEVRSCNSTTIRTMILGMGGISRTRCSARSGRQEPGTELVAVVDVNDEALQRAAADYSLPGSLRFSPIFRVRAAGTQSADVVLINTPSELALRAEQSRCPAKPV